MKSTRLLINALFGVLLTSGLGCAIPFKNESSVEQSNACSSNDDCSDGAACVEGLCVATKADLGDLILSIHPNAGASYGADSTFLIYTNQLTTLSGADDMGFSRMLNIELQAPVKVEGGKVTLDYASDCPLPADNSIPAEIVLERDPPYLGVRLDPIKITTELNADSTSYTFDADIQPDIYDVYITPLPVAGCAAPPPPPVVLRDQPIEKDGSLSWGMAKPQPLTGHVKVPSGGNIDGWLLDLVDHHSGHVISTTQTLKQEGLTLLVPVDLQYVEPQDPKSPYIRLRPSGEGLHSPKVYWELDSALLLSTDSVQLTIEDLLIQPRKVQVQVQDESGVGVVASVDIHSVSLSGNVAKIASYSEKIEQTGPILGTSVVGFETELPPGKYQVRATPIRPNDKALGVAELELDVPPAMNGDTSCICGRVITLPKRAVLEGRVETPSGEALISATVQTESSQPPASTYWSRVHSLDPLLPRPSSADPNSDGSFSLYIDHGDSDLFVKPREGSGYPWLVRPHISVEATDGRIHLDAPLRLSNPIILQGRVSDPAGDPVANADIRALLPVHDATNLEMLLGTVMEIGSTSTDDKGQFTLFLPASVTQ